jgi:hypothetical protein
MKGEFLGGEAKVPSVRACRETACAVVNAPQGKTYMQVELLLVFPERLWSRTVGPNGEMVMVLSPERALTTGPLGT